MKTNHLLSLLVVLCATVSVHAEKIVAGPKGGRLLEAEPLKAEFFVTPERKAEVIFYDANLKPSDPGAQTVAITAEPASGRVKLDLEKTPTGFVSRQALPEGAPYRVVVQTRASTEAKPKNFRVDLNLATCGECQHAEYACTCAGH